MKTRETIQLHTDGFDRLPKRGAPWNVYPRPQMRRDSFICLNGRWDFAVTAGDAEPETYDRSVTVPYPVEAELSGIGDHFPEGSGLWYRRKLPAVRFRKKQRVLLHLDAADRFAAVWINGKRFPEEGEFCTAVDGRATADITDALEKSGNMIVIRCRDDLNDRSVPYGKQTLKPGGMWYTPVSGIWQTVWMEAVPEDRIRRLKITPLIDGAEIEIRGAESGEIECEGEKYLFTDGRAVIRPEDPKLWTPETPHLYDFTVRTAEDCVQSYFAIRTVGIGEVDGVPRILLNGEPYFFNGVLDQGYWPDGLYTPADGACYEEDILAMKKLGFNMLRKHIKIEPESFYYACDRLGMAVFQDMVNNGDYSFFRDTVLPTIGLQKLNDEKLHRDEKTRRAFEKAAEAEVRQLYSHPCIVYWTVFNEGWGQFDSGRMYKKIKELDPTRIVDSASGWFRGGETDVDSRHVYFKKFRMPKRSGKPVVLSEFGGYVYKVKDHSFNPGNTYGYRFYKTQEKFEEAFRRLYEEQVIPNIEKGLCAAVYTQVSDVEDETNGLLTYDRKICKIDKR